jgi:membrane protease YdiL (CAAX protease family)
MIATWYDSSTVHLTGGLLGTDVLFRIESLLYIPALFMMEEVAFRRAIDSHVHYPPGDRHGVPSAFFVSVLWGLWHYPVVPPATVVQTIAQMLALQLTVGPFLSIYLRKLGNLMVFMFAHATIDSVRNALGFVR